MHQGQLRLLLAPRLNQLRPGCRDSCRRPAKVRRSISIGLPRPAEVVANVVPRDEDTPGAGAEGSPKETGQADAFGERRQDPPSPEWKYEHDLQNHTKFTKSASNLVLLSLWVRGSGED